MLNPQLQMMMSESRRRKRRRKGQRRRKPGKASSPRVRQQHPSNNAQQQQGGRGGKGHQRARPQPNKDDPRTKSGPAGVSFPYQYKRPGKDEMELYTYWSDHLHRLDTDKQKRDKIKLAGGGGGDANQETGVSTHKVKPGSDNTIVIKVRKAINLICASDSIEYIYYFAL